MHASAQVRGDVVDVLSVLHCAGAHAGVSLWLGLRCQSWWHSSVLRAYTLDEPENQNSN